MSIFTRQPAEQFDAPTTAVEDISGDYVIDPTHTRLGFSVRHAMVTTVRGQFSDLHRHRHHRHREPGQLQGPPRHRDRQHRDRCRRPRRPPAAPPTSSTPTTTRRSPSPRPTSSATATTGSITGDLAIKDVTKPVTIVFEPTGSARDPFGNLRVGFEGGTTINRKDWGLSYNAALETGGVLVSEKVKLDFDVSAIRNA